MKSTHKIIAIKNKKVNLKENKKDKNLYEKNHMKHDNFYKRKNCTNQHIMTIIIS